MLTLVNAAEKALRECMSLTEDESLLIVVDSTKLDIGRALLKAGKEISQKIKMVEIPVSRISGSEPPAAIATMMQDFNVVVMPTKRSFTHTRATKNAADNGVRVGTMPSITEDILCRCLDIDLGELAELTDSLKKQLDAANQARITTKAGTDITFSLKNREGVSSVGIARMERNITNIPSGEAFIAPVEGTANGIYVVDGSQAGIGKVDKLITFTVNDGFVTKIDGADSLQDRLESLNDKNVYNIAEFGIGTNKAAKIIGNVLEDEKVFGTCHIAIGSNAGFGGTVQTTSHLDGVMTSPSIYLDDQKIMEEGTLL